MSAKKPCLAKSVERGSEKGKEALSGQNTILKSDAPNNAHFPASFSYSILLFDFRQQIILKSYKKGHLLGCPLRLIPYLLK